MLVYRAQQVPDVELPVMANLLGVLTYAVIFAMVITTFSAPKRAIGPKSWKVLHKIGLYWLTAAFALTCGESPHRPFQHRVDLLRSLFLHPRENMAVDIQRDPDRRMPQPLAHDLRVHALLEQRGCVARVCPKPT